jgi:hypothetical protein
MAGPLDGYSVIEVEHPETGNPQGGLIASEVVPSVERINFLIEQPHRDKRSNGIEARGIPRKEKQPRSISIASHTRGTSYPIGPRHSGGQPDRRSSS